MCFNPFSTVSLIAALIDCASKAHKCYKHVTNCERLISHRAREPLNDSLLKQISLDNVSWEERVENWLLERLRTEGKSCMWGREEVKLTVAAVRDRANFYQPPPPPKEKLQAAVLYLLPGLSVLVCVCEFLLEKLQRERVNLPTLVVG